MAPRNQALLEKKNGFISKFKQLLKDYPRLLIVNANNVGSKHMQDIRMAIRGKAIMLMGKNTMYRKSLQQFQDEASETDMDVSSLLEIVKGNIGFIFCMQAPDEIFKLVSNIRVPAAAKAGMMAQCDVVIKAGKTGLGPTETQFFQALNIATKIVQSQIDIVSDVHLIKVGRRVNLSEQVLLQKLKITPFSYSLQTEYVFEAGSLFDASVLAITNESILSKFQGAIRNSTAFARQIGLPTESSVVQGLARAFKLMAALSVETEITFKEVETIKDYIKNPGKFAVAAAPAASPAAGKAASPKKGGKASPKHEPEEDAGGDFSLFD